MQSLASSLGVDGIPDQTVKVVGTTPVQVRFDMSAAAVGDTKLKFVASAVDATPDALEDGFEIEPTQDPVTIATSMAIEANAAGGCNRHTTEIHIEKNTLALTKASEKSD